MVNSWTPTATTSTHTSSPPYPTLLSLKPMTTDNALSSSATPDTSSSQALLVVTADHDLSASATMDGQISASRNNLNLKSMTTDNVPATAMQRVPSMPPRLDSLPAIPPILSPTLSMDGSATPRLRLAPAVMRRPPPDALPNPLARMPSLALLMEQQQHALEQQSLRTPRPQAQARKSLRVMPRLPLMGADGEGREREPTAVHEIEEEDDSDDDSGEAGPSASTSFFPDMPVVDSDVSEEDTPMARPQIRLRPTASSLVRQDGSPTDYFSQQSLSQEHGAQTPTPAFATPRPGLTRRVSRSMVDLSPRAGAAVPAAEANARGVGPSLPSGTRPLDGPSSPPLSPPAPPFLEASPSPTLAQIQAHMKAQGIVPPPAGSTRPQPRGRRSSLPAKLDNRPPPYSSHAALAPAPLQHDPREGRERLPEYSNSIYLAALVPRKMEFSAPHVLAKDRRWKKVWLVLEGTALKVYRDRSAFSFGASHHDATSPMTPTSASSTWRSRSRLNLPGRHERRSSSVPSGSASSSPRSSAERSRESVTTSATSHSSGSGPATPNPTASMPPVAGKMLLRAGVHPFDAPPTHKRASLSVGGQVFFNPAASSSSVSLGLVAHSHAPDTRAPPLRCYSMQHAESGIGSDYAKRPHVVRVRAEGEQFLVQLGGVEDVIRWVEGFQAAANVALDLDERPMPRGPLYPRRRRRRRRPEEDAGPGPSVVPGGVDAQNQ